jgi:hypothetical protein
MTVKSQQHWALVTGATSGIGLALANELASAGMAIALVARDSERLAQAAADLERLHGVACKTLAVDLSKPESPQHLAAWLQREGIEVDTLVNNAGFANFGSFDALSLRAELDQIQLNVTAVTHLTKLLLPAMLSRGRGAVLNVASTSGFNPAPLMATYNATKAFVLYFTEALAAELKGSGVRVTALCPGYTSTGFQARAGMQDSEWVRSQKGMAPAEVARKAIVGMRRGRVIVVPGLINRVMAFLPRLLPRGWTVYITHWVLAR